MKLISTRGADDLLATIKVRFAEYNRSSRPGRGRKYPKDLMDIVRQAIREGTDASALCRITGVSSSAMQRWAEVAASEATPTQRSARTVRPARRLEVVGEMVSKTPTAGGVVIRLPSGITIELADRSALDAQLLVALAAVEVGHAASR